MLRKINIGGEVSKGVDNVSKQSSNVGIISVLRRDYFLNKWLRGASGYPVYFPRIFRKGSVFVERKINEVYISKLQNAKIKFYINHFPFRSGVSHWVDKHNLYSSMEAKINDSISTLSNDQYTVNRIKMKKIFYKLPLRSLIMFLYLYVYKRGFLAGKAGFYFCLLC